MTTLVAVRTALKASDSEHAAVFTSLLDSGNLVPYKSKESISRKLGLAEADCYPRLGKKQAPIGLRTPPALKELHEICLRDFPMAREYFGDRLVYCPQTDTPTDDDAVEMKEEETGMRTITDLRNAEAGANGTIVTFPSESLEELCSQGYEPPENLLRAAMTTCTILPRNTLLPLHHSNEGTTFTTLLSGSVIWIIWPPTEHNIHSLRTAYENFADDFDETQIDVAGALEGGMTFVQSAGEGMRIPAFCAMMCLSTTTSVLATYAHITVQDFIATLHKLPLLRAWFRTELDGTRKQSDFNASILRCLDLMLNGDADDEDRDAFKLEHAKDGLLDQLLSAWDKVKNDVAAMMGPTDCKTMESIWEAFLISAKGRECRICNKRVANKQKLMKKHFIEAHWSKVKASKRVDSMEAMDEEGNGAELVEMVEESAPNEVAGGDAMEVDE
jgi:hypothetical protein